MVQSHGPAARISAATRMCAENWLAYRKQPAHMDYDAPFTRRLLGLLSTGRPDLVAQGWPLNRAAWRAYARTA